MRGIGNHKGHKEHNGKDNAGKITEGTEDTQRDTERKREEEMGGKGRGPLNPGRGKLPLHPRHVCDVPVPASPGFAE